MSFPNDRTYTYDANLLLSDNAAAYTASGYAKAGGADGIVDLGGNQGVSPALTARIDAICIVDVTALDVASNDETYKIAVVVSNDAAFGAGKTQVAAMIEMGASAAALDVPNNVTAVIGRAELGFTNQIAGTIYQFAKLYLAIGGTTPSINIFSFIAVLPEG